MGTGVTLLLWPPGNLVPGIRFVGRGMRAAQLRRTDRPRAYCYLMNQSSDRYLEFLSNSINRNIKLPAVPVWETVAEYSAISSFYNHTLTIKRSE